MHSMPGQSQPNSSTLTTPSGAAVRCTSLAAPERAACMHTARRFAPPARAPEPCRSATQRSARSGRRTIRTACAARLLTLLFGSLWQAGLMHWRVPLRRLATAVMPQIVQT
eukprot:scaffold3740_cov322-Prasinococcus_capsulatus_cf.AAC.5